MELDHPAPCEDFSIGDYRVDYSALIDEFNSLSKEELKEVFLITLGYNQLKELSNVITYGGEISISTYVFVCVKLHSRLLSWLHPDLLESLKEFIENVRQDKAKI
jgi:Mg2+/Co2+ transporter CorC